jgi:RNA recognition motif-containing protein
VSGPSKCDFTNPNSTAERKKVHFGSSRHCIWFHRWQIKVGDESSDWWGFGKVHENQLDQKWCVGETLRSYEEIKNFYDGYKKTRKSFTLFDTCQDFVLALTEFLDILPLNGGCKGIPPIAERGALGVSAPSAALCLAGNAIGFCSGFNWLVACGLGGCFAASELVMCEGIIARGATLTPGKGYCTCSRSEASAILVTEDNFSQYHFYPFKSVEEAKKCAVSWRFTSSVIFGAVEGVIIQDCANKHNSKIFSYTRTRDKTLIYDGVLSLQKVSGTLPLKNVEMTPREESSASWLQNPEQAALYGGNVYNAVEGPVDRSKPRQRLKIGQIRVVLPRDPATGKIKDGAQIKFNYLDESKEEWGEDFDGILTKRVLFVGGPSRAHARIKRVAHKLCSPPI